MTIKNQKIETTIIDRSEYDSLPKSYKLFEDDHPFSFGKINLATNCLKFAWNSKNITPSVKYLEESQMIFIGVDNFIRGFSCRSSTIDFSINTESFFKWFDEIDNGIIIVAESEIIILNTRGRCSLRKVIFCTDTIMSTKIDRDMIIVGFLTENEKIFRIW